MSLDLEALQAKLTEVQRRVCRDIARQILAIAYTEPYLDQVMANQGERMVDNMLAKINAKSAQGG